MSESPWARFRWRIRRRVWTVIWSIAVLGRLRASEVRAPRRKEEIRLIHAPRSYPDFKAPSLVVPANLPDRESSLIARLMVRFIHFLQDFYPIVVRRQPAAEPDRRARAARAFSRLYRRAIDPPRWHDDLVRAEAGGNLLGVLATSGPFSKLVARSPEDGRFRTDLGFMADYPVRDGLRSLGCVVEYVATGDGELEVDCIVRGGEEFRPADRDWKMIEEVALCSLLTHLTVWRHGMQYHVGGLGPLAILTHNLPPAHPVRRLLAPHIDQTAATNYHTHLTLRRGGFDVTGFSFSYETILRYYDDGVRAFDLAELDVRRSRARRNIPSHVGAEYHAQALAYWDLFAEYVAQYIGYYYSGETRLAGDGDLAEWFAAVDHWVPNGVRGYTGDLSREGLERLLTLFIYSVTVEHEENTQWKYAPFLAPTVHADGTGPTVGEVQTVMNFQFVISSAQNKLARDFSHLAPDPGGAAIMKGLGPRLRRLESVMGREPDRFWTVRPSELEASVSA
jgi:hypothetical protein